MEGDYEDQVLEAGSKVAILPDGEGGVGGMGWGG